MNDYAGEPLRDAPAVIAPEIDLRRELARALRQITPRERKFVRIYYDGGACSRDRAAEATGYTRNGAWRVLQREQVRAVMRLLDSIAAEQLGVSAYSLMYRAIAVYDRAMDEDRPQLGAAMQALEFLRTMAHVSEQPAQASERPSVVVIVPPVLRTVDDWQRAVDHERAQGLLPGVT